MPIVSDADGRVRFVWHTDGTLAGLIAGTTMLADSKAGKPWTATEVLPGGDVRNFNAFRDDMQARYTGLGRNFIDGVVRRHGSRTPQVLGDATMPEALGRHFGGGLTQREVEYLVAEEWAETADDVLWRRTKCGLPMTSAQRGRVAEYIGA